MDSITKNTAVIATSRYHGISTEGTLAIVVVSAVILSTAVRDVDALFLLFADEPSPANGTPHRRSQLVMYVPLISSAGRGIIGATR